MKKEFLFVTAFFAGLFAYAEKPSESAEEIDAIALEEITVSSTRAGNETPVAYSNLNQQEIKRDNAGKNIPLLLETQPSVVAFGEGASGVGNTSLRIRGVDATRINVTLNGMPLNNPESQEVYWVNLPDLSNSLQSIQVQRGVGTSTNGTASIGGSISLNTVGAREHAYGEVSGALGSYDTYLYSIAGGSGILKNGLSIDARYSQIGSDGYIRNGKVDHSNIYAALSYFTENDLLRLSYMRGVQHTGITWEGISPEQLKENRRYNPAGEYIDDEGNVRYYGNETDNYYSDIAQLVYSRFINPNLSVNANLSYNHGYGYYENYKTDRKFGSYYGLPDQTVDGVTYSKSDAIQRKLMKNDFYAGNVSVNYKKNGLNLTGGGMVSYYDGDHYGNILWTKYNENIPANYEWYRNDAQKKDFNIFAKATYAINSRFSLFGDMQYRYVDYRMKGLDDDFADIKNNNYYSFFNPKVGMTFKLNDAANYGELYTYFSIVNREPLRADIKESIKGGNTEKIEPERMFDYELGYKIRKSVYDLNINFYYMDYNDQMVQTGKLNDTGYKLMENVADSYRYGVEISASVRPMKCLQIDANATFSQNKIKNYTAYYDLYDTDWNYLGQEPEFLPETGISFSPNIIGSGVITYMPIENLSLRLVNKYVGKQYYDNTSNKENRLDDYYVANFVFSYLHKMKKFGEIELQLHVNNLFDKEYVANAWTDAVKFSDGTKEVYTGLYPQPTRNFMTKLVFRF